MKNRVRLSASLALLALALSFADAYDPSPLQDICVAVKEPDNALFVDQLPGLNTLGISMVRIDFGIGGLNPPHFHPRGSEILLVLEGTLYAGFVTSNQLNHTFFEKVLHPGDAFVFPFGMIHFQLNVGKTNAVAIAGFSSQSPGITWVANALFSAKPPISPEVLAKGFQVDEKLVETLQKKFWYEN
ncbi:germin-like protein subfamily 1 member 16 isoform X2 [Rhodamnia argentea]|uniref:Germin-like protein n=1 Tax=Rhodamnia argentea TaxID=178133 RepID=A0ABM3HDE4_9MYRT|nr:germin-like protein subfamily 1 member 16 isoform X2 [Rhodamnia argentea]